MYKESLMCETNNEIFLGLPRVSVSVLKATPIFINTDNTVAATKAQINRLICRLLTDEIPEKTKGITKSGITFLIILAPVLRSEVQRRATTNNRIKAMIGFKTG